MYYSILPFDEDSSLNVEYKEVMYKNQLVLVKNINGIQMLERLYSTNPKDYLNPDFQPGTILENPLINN